jgi:septal ring factor EnvC (AmiA/AmiB activator)
MLARFAAVASIVLPLAIAVPSQPAAQKGTPAEALRQRAADRIRALQAEAASLASHEKTLLGELRRLEIERDLRTMELERIEPEIAALETQVVTTSADLDALDQKLRAQQPALAARLVDTYKLGRAGYVRLWFAVDDLRALGRAYRLVSALARIDRDRLDDYRTTVDRLSTTRADLDRRFSELAMLRDEALSVRADMNDAVAAHVALIADIDRRRDLNAQLIGELQQAQDRLEQVVASLPPGRETLPEGAEPLALPLAPFKGTIDWPVSGAVSTPFGPRVNPRLGTTTLSTGIEIAAPDGAAVAAIHDGTVAFADAFAGFGLLVILDHGRQSHSLYGHLGAIEVSAGAHVTTGQAVGTVGRGPLGRPSLYFELRVDGQPVDPVQWLKAK